ncbi:MAG: DNA-binding protein [Flavobacteriaceae bacterium]|nr:DNA-binding protein [Flavobacteriaceae bacterium]
MLTYSLNLRSNPQNRSQKKWYATPRITGYTNLGTIAEKLSRESTVSIGDVYAVLYGAINIINDELAEGRKVEIGKLGQLQIRFGSEGADTPEEFHVGMIKNQRVKLSEGEELKKQLPFLKYKRVDPLPKAPATRKKSAKQKK